MYYRTRITGPLVLITIGVLFMLDKWDMYEFGRTWPVILVVIGLSQLIQRMVHTDPQPWGPPTPPTYAAPPTPPPPPPPGAVNQEPHYPYTSGDNPNAS